jgi:hypothetical protein
MALATLLWPLTLLGGGFLDVVIDLDQLRLLMDYWVQRFVILV